VKRSRHRRSLRRDIVALGALLIVVGGHGTSSAQSRCLSAKLDALGLKEARLLFCLAGVAAKGRANSFPACLQRAAGKYAAAFGRAGACAGERTECECLADKCALDLRVMLSDPGPSKCAAARLRAAGREAVGKVRCSVRALRKGLVVEQTCIQRAEQKFQAAFAKTGSCAGEQAGAEALVNDECVRALGGDATGGGMVTGICTSEACQGVDARG
jgi:hypothetical protein